MMDCVERFGTQLTRFRHLWARSSSVS